MKDRIKKLRKFQGMNQGELALKAGVAQSRISDWENGAEPSLHNLTKLAIALETTIDYLVTGK